MDLERPDGAPALALLLHPHPDMGGDRHNHVIGALFRGLPAAGIGAARFDFTTSAMDQAVAETVDALEEAVAAAPGSMVVVVGYSFGAMVASRVTDERVAGWFLVAPPIDHLDLVTLAGDPRPKALAVPEHDFSPPDRVAEVTTGWPATERQVVPGADHFLATTTDTVVRQVVAWVRSLPGS